jgi:glycosyltransferase involved in cell wall biosynthesis
VRNADKRTRVCMISSHLPPEQAANALLPAMLASELTAHGIDSRYVTHRPSSAPTSLSARDRGGAVVLRETDEAAALRRADGSGDEEHTFGPNVTYVPRRRHDGLNRTVAGAMVAAARMAWGARRPIGCSDLVHLHSNGFVIEVGALVSRLYRKPYVITLYGTDVWHHDAARNARFGRVVRKAGCRIFYSQGLLDFARGLGLAPDPSCVIYAPVPDGFRPVAPDARRRIREELGVGDRPLLLTVKRLHPVAGHEDLLHALPSICREFPDAQLWVVGQGELRSSLEALASELGVGSRVRFLGRLGNDTLWRYYAAADLFILPSRLESWGTVMLESLACGTPVVATATAGAREVRGYFPADVALCELGNAESLVAEVTRALRARRRADEGTIRLLRERFSPAGCASEYLRVYRDILDRTR